MTITLPPDIEDLVARQARLQGTTPETLALDSLRESLREKIFEQPHPVVTRLREPCDEWERLLRGAASPAGVSLSDEQLSRDVIYADRDWSLSVRVMCKSFQQRILRLPPHPGEGTA